jgi:polysaccharide export outer membrane protein
VLQLTFTFTPEFDQSVTVGPDGYISPKGVADVHVEGLSAPEVSAALQKAYSKVLHDPIISVIPTTVVPAYFIAGGEVGKPGKYTLQGNTTVTQAVQIAGGFTENAKHSELVLFRRINSDWVQGTKINVKEMLKSGNLAEDLNLQPGDMLYAPKNTISKVQTWTLPWSQFMKLNFITKPIY